MKMLILLSVLFFSVSCLKKAEEAVKSEKKSEDVSQPKEDNKPKNSIVGKWKFSADERGMKIVEMKFKRIDRIPSLPPACSDEENLIDDQLVAVYLNLKDDESYAITQVYETCSLQKVGDDYSYDSSTKEFLSHDEEKPVYIHIRGDELTLKTNHVNGVWDYTYDQWSFVLNEVNYEYEFTFHGNESFAGVPVCDDHFDFSNTEFHMYYEFYVDESYKEFDIYKDLNTGDICTTSSWEDNYSYEDNILTFISNDSSWTFSYQLLFTEDRAQFYLKTFFN